MITQILFTVLSFIVGAIGWRERGSDVDTFNLEGNVSRLIYWCLPAAFLTMLFHHHNVWLEALTIPVFLLGCAPGYFGGDWDFKNPKKYNLWNFLRLAIRGAWICIPYYALTYFLSHYHYSWIPDQLRVSQAYGLGGIIMGLFFVVYYIIGLKLEKYKPWLLTDFPAWGEFLLGGFVMAGLSFPI